MYKCLFQEIEFPFLDYLERQVIYLSVSAAPLEINLITGQMLLGCQAKYI